MLDRFRLEPIQKDNRFFLFSYGVMALACAFFLVARYTEWLQMPGIGSELQPEYVEFAAAKRYVTIGFLEENGYGYALLERFAPERIQMQAWPAWAFWAGFLPCFAIALACVSYVTGFGFYVCLTAVTLLAGLFLPDTLFGASQWGYRAVQLGMIVALGGGVYYFNQFKKEAGIGLRFGYFFGVNLLWYGLAVLAGSGAPAVQSLAGYAVIPLVVITLLFILQASYTLPYLGMQLAVRQNISSTLSYTLMMLFFGGNLFVYYQHSRGMLEGFLFYLDPLLILPLAALLGYSTFRDFSENGYSFFESINSRSWAFYPAWGAIAILTIAFAAATDNGPLLEVFEDAAALFGAGACLFWLAYALINFWEPMWKSLRVDRIFFEPRYLLTPMWVMILTVSFGGWYFMETNRYQLRQALAGRFMALADAAWMEAKYQDAELFYLQATDNDPYAFRPNYMLSVIAAGRNVPMQQLDRLEDAVNTKPRPAAYLALGNYHADRNDFFDALRWYQQGIEKFPESAELGTNLAVHLAKSELTDSLAVVVKRMLASGRMSESVQANLAALLAMQKLPENVSGLVKEDVVGKTANGQANLALWQAAQGKRCQQKPEGLSAQNPFFVLFDLVSACPEIGVQDSTLRQASYGLPNAAEDVAYLEAIRLGAAGNEALAFNRLRELARNSDYLKAPYYQAAIVRAMERGGIDQAKELLMESARILPEGFSQSLWLDLAGYPAQWAGDSSAPRIPMAQKLFTVAETKPEEVENLPEEERLLWLVANRNQSMPIETARTILSFKTPDLSWSALAAVSELYLREGDFASLTDLATRLSGNMPKEQTPEIAQAARIRLLDGWLGSPGQGRVTSRPALIQATGNELVDAALAELSKSKPNSNAISKALQAFPFRSYLLQAAVERMNELNSREPAYQLTLQAYQVMPEVEGTARAYILQAALMDYDSFAASALDAYQERFGKPKADALRRSLNLQPGERPMELSL